MKEETKQKTCSRGHTYTGSGPCPVCWPGSKVTEHYICLGGCRGVSKTPGVCKAPNCRDHNHELVKCDCADGLHNDFKQIS